MKSSLHNYTALHRVFFVYSFLYFTWIFFLYGFSLKSQKQLLQRSFRNGLRFIHRCAFARAADLMQITKEKPREEYLERYGRKRFKKFTYQIWSIRLFTTISFNTFHLIKETMITSDNSFKLKDLFFYTREIGQWQIILSLLSLLDRFQPFFFPFSRFFFFPFQLHHIASP